MKKQLLKIFSVFLIFALFFTSMPCSSAKEAKHEGNIFRCDWFNESLYYPFEYNDSIFFDSAYNYNHELAKFALCVSMASFKNFDKDDPDKNICEMLGKCGFDTVSFNYDSCGYDTMGIAVGKKEINNNGEKFTQLILAIRSGNYGMEWGGNLRVGYGVNHEGFDIGKKLSIKYFNEYCKNLIRSDSKIKLLISGYSRGGSVANLFAAELDDGSYKSSLDTDYIANLNIQREDCFTYTFEAPKCTNKENCGNSVYKNIYNIINPNDYVSKFVMDSWNFDVYGEKYYLPSADNCEKYDEYYDKLCNEFNTMMSKTKYRADDMFYNKEDSLSVGAQLDYLMEKLVDEVFINQKTYANTFEAGFIFIAGQYIGQNLKLTNALTSLKTMLFATALSVKPSNISSIKSNGFRHYIANSLFNNDIGDYLTDKEIEGVFELVNRLLDFMHDNQMDCKVLGKQLKTIASVHQPYVELTWMRILTQDDMSSLNRTTVSEIKPLYKTLKLYQGSHAIVPIDNTEERRIEFKSESPLIATVQENGIITAVNSGTTNINIMAYDKNGKIASSKKIVVTVKSDLIHKIRLKIFETH